MSQKWINRENKRNAKRKRMPKHGMSLFTIEEETRKRAEKAKTQNYRVIRAKKKAGKIPDFEG